MSIVQNVFEKRKVHRTISEISYYLLLFKNLRDETQMSSLDQQVFPIRVKSFIDYFRDATKNDYGYLLLDLHPLATDSDSDEHI